MTHPTVYAVVTATIEIAVRPSNANEKLIDLQRIAKQEAEDILRTKLQQVREINVQQGSVRFSHAVVKGGDE